VILRDDRVAAFCLHLSCGAHGWVTPQIVSGVGDAVQLETGDLYANVRTTE
jgi:hypothetical protein